jgi:hypothetical protein
VCDVLFCLDYWWSDSQPFASASRFALITPQLRAWNPDPAINRCRRTADRIVAMWACRVRWVVSEGSMVLLVAVTSAISCAGQLAGATVRGGAERRVAQLNNWKILRTPPREVSPSCPPAPPGERIDSTSATRTVAVTWGRRYPVASPPGA